MAINDQAAAAQGLLQVLDHGKSTDQLKPQSAFCQELIFGTLRHLLSLQAQVDERLDNPVRNKDRIVYILMLVGAYQLRFSTKPAHAVVNETVKAAGNIGRPWARGLLNAVLRNLPTPLAHSEHPPWWVQRIQQDYPDNWQSILQANNERAPMQLRINRHKIDPAAYLAKLTAANISYNPGWFPNSVTLDSPLPTKELPGYQAGEVSVQDLGAQAAAHLFGDGVLLPLLDACAAPGHKLFHIIEGQTAVDEHRDKLASSPQWTAAEISAPRMAYLKAEASRLNHNNIEYRLANAAEHKWPEQSVKTILIDAPCSGSGTLRRHPDIKHLRTNADIANYARLQYDLLVNLWPVLQPGGRLLYSTCSIFHEENDDVIRRFLDHAAIDPKGTQAEIEAVNLPDATQTQYGCQILPPATDGFYYALIKKTFA